MNECRHKAVQKKLFSLDGDSKQALLLFVVDLINSVRGKFYILIDLEKMFENSTKNHGAFSGELLSLSFSWMLL